MHSHHNSQNSFDKKSSSKSSSEPNFELFISGDLQAISIAVIGTEKEIFKYMCFKIEVKSPYFPTFYSYRRYNEFYALHKALKIRYENLDFPPFPPKIQIFNKVETRKYSFHLLLNKVLEVAIIHYQAQKTLTLLKTLYAFLTKNISGIKAKNPTQIRTTNSGTIIENENDKTLNSSLNDSKKNEDSDGDESEIVEKFSKILLATSKEEDFDDKTKKKEEIEEKTKKRETEERKKQKFEPEEKIDNKVRIPDEHLLKKDSIDSKSSMNILTPIIERANEKKWTFEKPAEKKSTCKKEKEDKNSVVNTPRETKNDTKAILKNKFNNFASNNKILKNFFGNPPIKNEIVLQVAKPAKNAIIKNIIDDSDFDYLNFYENEIPNFGGNIWVKFKNERKWTLFYGKLQDSNILLFSSILENNFNVLINVYGSNISVIEYYEDLQYIEVYHNYDRDKTLISIEPPKKKFEAMTNNDCSSPTATYKDKNIELQKWFKQLKIASEKVTNFFSIWIYIHNPKIPIIIKKKI